MDMCGPFLYSVVIVRQGYTFGNWEACLALMKKSWERDELDHIHLQGYVSTLKFNVQLINPETGQVEYLMQAQQAPGQ